MYKEMGLLPREVKLFSRLSSIRTLSPFSHFHHHQPFTSASALAAFNL